MSSRNFRKLCGSSLPPPGSDDSDGEFDPSANRQPKKSAYEGLELSSNSSSERDPDAEELDESQETGAASLAAQRAVRKKKNKKKGKGKGKGKKRISASGDSGHDTSESTTSNCRALSRCRPSMPGLELDEIDKSLMEVNALLGAPPPAPVELRAQTKFEEMQSILAVQAKFLNVTYEVKRLFGPEDPEEIRQRQKTQPHRARVLRRVTVGPNYETPLYVFKNTGLSMSIEKRDNGIVHFVYDHDQDYRKMHHSFLEKYTRNYITRGTVLFTLEEARQNMHVEPLLEIADTLCRVEEYRAVNEIVENVVTYLQYVAHPSFNLASQKVRLSYDYMENRPFHVAMLKYMYLLTNKACHRTALEIAKMLMNIDPTDPLAVLFVIDTLAIRAREHQWLIEAIEYFNEQRQANLLFNIQYSYALAHFHVAIKKKKELCEADKYLQIAIMSYPQVVLKILEYAYVKEPKIENHVLFTNEPRSLASEGLSELIMIYAKMTWSRWREPQVMDWFVKNAIEVTENFNNSQEVRDRVGELAVLRHSIFQSWPSEIMRHISIIRPMANLLLETTLRPSSRLTCSWDPLFEHGINRYSYKAHSEPPRIMSSRGALLYRFFTSMLPSTELEPPVHD